MVFVRLKNPDKKFRPKTRNPKKPYGNNMFFEKRILKHYAQMRFFRKVPGKLNL